MAENNLEMKIVRLEYQVETLHGDVKDLKDLIAELNKKFVAVDKLTTYGRVIVSILMAVGLFFGWILSQITAFKNVFGPHP